LRLHVEPVDHHPRLTREEQTATSHPGEHVPASGGWGRGGSTGRLALRRPESRRRCPEHRV